MHEARAKARISRCWLVESGESQTKMGVMESSKAKDARALRAELHRLPKTVSISVNQLPQSP
jgi:hypothetical protein